MSASPALRRRLAALAILALQPSLAVAPLAANSPSPANVAPGRDPDEYLIVDCLLPGKVRRLGRRVTYLSPRRALRTTALDCGIRGGEYTAFDRADYRTALAVWQEQADAGEAEAQYMVAQIYEKGLGTPPDYARAASWYRKAADQGHNASQISLGYLLEQGLGVTANSAEALDWYRRAAGLPADLVVLTGAEAAVNQQQAQALAQELEELRRRLADAEERADAAGRAAAAAATSATASAGAAQQEQERLRSVAATLRQELAAKSAEAADRQRLERALADQELEIAALRRRAEAAEQRAEAASAAAGAAAGAAASGAATAAAEQQERLRLQAEADTLRQELATKSAAAARARADLERQLAEAAPSAGTPPRPVPATVTAAPIPDLDFGRYRALVIGNADYATLPDLPAARVAARGLASVLETRYAFRVTLLLDADRAALLSALNILREQLAQQDNLLVFYAGHSVRDPAGDRGWWQPIDADSESRVRWIPTQVIADHLELMPARHALLVADAHFPGVLTRSSIPRLAPGLSVEKKRQALAALLQKRSRLVLSPGEGVESPGGSVFSSGLLEVLGKSTGVLEASTLYQELNNRLLEGPKATAAEFAPMRWAAHEGGADFFLVAKTGH
jgi:Caspase domain/Sel1 repeat